MDGERSKRCDIQERTDFIGRMRRIVTCQSGGQTNAG
jgi:hypothetical protein